MSILRKIKQSVKKIMFRDKKNEECIVPHIIGIDISESEDFTANSWVQVSPLGNREINRILMAGRGKKPWEKNVNPRLKKAKNIYNSTKKSRIKKKQLKIIRSEERVLIK